MSNHPKTQWLKKHIHFLIRLSLHACLATWPPRPQARCELPSLQCEGEVNEDGQAARHSLMPHEGGESERRPHPRAASSTFPGASEVTRDVCGQYQEKGAFPYKVLSAPHFFYCQIMK